MLSSRARNLCLALIPGALAATVMFAGTAAAAGPKAITKTTAISTALGLPSQADNAGVGISVLDCPEGTAVTGGGGLFPTGAPTNTAIALFESGPSGIGWSVRYDNDTAVPLTVTNNAICMKNKLKIKGAARSASAGGAAQAAAAKPRAGVGLVQQVTQQVQLPPQATNNGVAEFTVNCPTGTVLVGGGAQLAAGSPLTTNTELFESGPVGNGWHVRWNNNQAVNQGASLTALCMNERLKVKGSLAGLKKPKARTAIQQVQQPVSVPPQATNAGVIEQNVSCPTGTTIVGGGARFDPTIPLTSGIELFESGPAGNGWHVRWNNDTNTPQPGAVLARCIKSKLTVK